MAICIVSLIAVISTLAFLFLWFRDVRRVMRERASTVESALGQLSAIKKWTYESRGDPDLAAVLERNKKIYQQAVTIYNRTLQKPWYCIPAHLMGFHHILQSELPE